jgi:hypothetical protein
VRRRDLISALLLAFSAGHAPVLAQGRVWRLGYLNPGVAESPGQVALLQAFTDQLERLGYSEGKNLAIIKRAAGGNYGRLDELAHEMVGLGPDAIAERPLWHAFVPGKGPPTTQLEPPQLDLRRPRQADAVPRKS